MNAIEKPVVLVIDPDALTLTAIAAMLDSALFQSSVRGIVKPPSKEPANWRWT